LDIIRKFPKIHQLSKRERGGKRWGEEKANQPIRKRMGLLADSEMESRKGTSFVRNGLILYKNPANRSRRREKKNGREKKR
jgi:hypothetical protein